MDLFEEAWATFDDNEKRTYRYALGRRWSEGPSILFIMLNPSTADEKVLDPTVRRCRTFAEKWGFGTLLVANLYALRSTDPKGLDEADDPVGPQNDMWIKNLAEQAACIVVAWGALKWAQRREEPVRNLLNSATLYCLGTTKQGHPRHPLYVHGDTKLQEWKGGDVESL